MIFKSENLAVVCLLALVFMPVPAKANSGDFSGGVAIGSSYAGVDTAPSNGLIIQGAVGIGSTSPSDELDVNGGMGFTTTSSTVPTNGIYSPSVNQLNVTTSGNTALSITSSGYVGIGKTPGTALDVNGFIRSSPTSGGGVVQLGMAANTNLDQTVYFDQASTYRGYSGFIGTNAGLGARNNTMELGSNGVDITIRPSETEVMRLTSSGVKIEAWAAASATGVCQNGNVLSTCSSSIRYKEMVKPASFGLKEVMELQPITFKWKGRDEQDFGLIAEDAAKVNPLFVTYARGQIEGVKYPQLTAVLIKAVQQQQAEIEALQAEVTALKAGAQ